VRNAAFAGPGFADAGFRPERPVLAQHVSVPDRISGGSCGGSRPPGTRCGAV